MTGTYQRNPVATEKLMDDVAFLAHPEGGLYQLNVTGRALWALMKTPVTEHEAVEALAQAFPDQPRTDIANDVSTVIADFEAKDLVIRRAGMGI